MRVSELVKKVETELDWEFEESQNQRDARVESLWRKLDPQGHNELDIKALKKGLQRIDHRARHVPRLRENGMLTPATAMKNADDMLAKIMSAVDRDGDGKIQYEGSSMAVVQWPLLSAIC
jgi:solute carrier family 25 (mitochondrial phosphate transporter), member 23/24/25/41